MHGWNKFHLIASTQRSKYIKYACSIFVLEQLKSEIFAKSGYSLLLILLAVDTDEAHTVKSDLQLRAPSL